MTATTRSAAIGEALELGAIARAAAEPDQVELFELPTRLEGARGDEQRAKVKAQGPGRPPGARNKSTVAIRDYLLARGVDPLVRMAQWAMHTPETLATELDCSKLEAFRELRATWLGLAPYLHGHAAPVDQDGNAVPILQMIIGGELQGARPGGAPPWKYIEELQAVNDPAGDVSHAAVSHGAAK